MPSVASRYGTGGQRFERPSGVCRDELRAPVVLMVSGGADSTALLVLAATSTLDIADGRKKARVARERLHVLHVNHQLRGLNAQEDEEFVCELAARYGIPVSVRRADVAALAAASAGGNVENAGRVLRYTEAAKLANKLSKEFKTPRAAARILTAHTADDRAETFFMNVMRGTGPAGLASIPRKRNRIVRPLLDRTHAELCEMLRMKGIVWREDATNADTRYLRAYVRHELMPVIERRNPHAVASLGSTCDILSDEDAYLTQVAARAYRDLTRREGEGMVALDAGRLAAADVAIARRIIRRAILIVCPSARLEARHIAAVLRLLATGTGSTQVSFGVDVRIEYGLLFVRSARYGSKRTLAGWLEVPAPGEAAGISQNEGRTGSFMLPDGRILTARLVQVMQGSDPVSLAQKHGQLFGASSVLLDAKAAGVDVTSGGRLWVDAPAAGDVLCPFGMHGQSKKLSDLLCDARIPAQDRSRVPVVRVSPTGAIVWVAGIRADERLRCTQGSSQLLELCIVSKKSREGSSHAGDAS